MNHEKISNFAVRHVADKSRRSASHVLNGQITRLRIAAALISQEEENTKLTSSRLLREASFLRMTVLPRCGSAPSGLGRLVTRGSGGFDHPWPTHDCRPTKSPAKGYSVFPTVLRPSGGHGRVKPDVKSGPVGSEGPSFGPERSPASGRA